MTSTEAKKIANKLMWLKENNPHQTKTFWFEIKESGQIKILFCDKETLNHCTSGYVFNYVNFYKFFELIKNKLGF